MIEQRCSHNSDREVEKRVLFKDMVEPPSTIPHQHHQRGTKSKPQDHLSKPQQLAFVNDREGWRL